MKRLISMILVIAMSVGMLPVEDIVYAATDATVKRITITKKFIGTEGPKEYYVDIAGENLRGLEVRVVGIASGSQILKAKPDDIGDYSVRYDLEGLKGIKTLQINKEIYDFAEDDIPSVTGTSSKSNAVIQGGDIKLEGYKFKNIDTPDKDPKENNNKILAYLDSGNGRNYISKPNFNKTIELKDIKNIGSYILTFERNKKIENVDMRIEHVYEDIFSAYKELDIKGDIEMTPNQGPKETEVTISAEELDPNMSVFFLKSTDDTPSIDYMGTDGEYLEGGTVDNKKKPDQFKVKVPSNNKISSGRYYVLLTNRVDPKGDIGKQVIERKTFDGNEFIVIDSNNRPFIESVSPNTKEPKEDVTIVGRYIGMFTENLYKNGKEKGVTISDDNKTLIVKYEKGTYAPLNNLVVETLERHITATIGDEVEFKDKQELSRGIDKVNVTLPDYNTSEGDLTKDVVIDIKTIINKGKTNEVIINETAIKKDGFTYIPSTYKPEITDVVPDRIPVEEIGSENKTAFDLKIAIHGKNFLMHQYTENNVVKYKYPIINLGNQVILNKNNDEHKDIEIEIFDKDGKEVDGTIGNELGTKMIVKIPKGYPKQGTIDVTGTNTFLEVINPYKGSDDKGDGLSSKKENVVKFVKLEGDIPSIETVSPNIITTEGYKGVVVKGYNFGNKPTLYMDGEEIKPLKIDGISEEITFDAPSLKAGDKQIYIMNSEGKGVVYEPFTYVETYTNPKITDFNPKKGTANALVTLEGQNLVPPNPIVNNLGGTGIWRLIGTRVYLGDRDINDYYIKTGEKSPSLQEYTSPSKDRLIQMKDNRLTLSDYYNSIVLEENGSDRNYYTVYFDTNKGEYKLIDGDKEEYVIKDEISGVENEFISIKDGKEFKIIVGTKQIEIKNSEVGEVSTKILNIKTPYATKIATDKDEIIGKVEKGDQIIIGNKTKVINNNELIFRVPSMPREGYYDVKIVNPDTESDIRKDKSGFYYSFQPEYNPKIKEVKPNEGSIDGGYFIDITGEGFFDRGGEDKTSVTIGRVKVDSKDITVAPDGNTLTVKVPEYPGNLKDETEMDRKSVTVGVLNPDGGSASRENGFTYIIPVSQPTIKNLILKEGSAAGGESVIIEGSGFRFFEPYKDENINREWDKGEPYTDINGNKKWDDLRHWKNEDVRLSYEDLLTQPNAYNKLIKPILPKIYFGSQQAKVIDFTESTIEVETPKGKDESVDVYLVNNDKGTSNKLKYNYKASKPNIDTIVPNVGRKQGNDKVEILGSSFYNSNLLLITGDETTEEQNMPLVQFGDINDENISNKSIGIDALENSGRIRDKRSTIEVGDLKVVYDVSGNRRDLSFEISEGVGNDKKKYDFTYKAYKDTEIFLPTDLLKDKDGNSYDSKEKVSEYIRVRFEKVEGASSTHRIRVDRGFSPKTELLNNGQISLRTPAYYTIGKTKVTIINPDSGTTSGDFEYKNPDSSPTIKDILKENDEEEGRLEEYENDGEIETRKIIEVNINGGNNIDIIGTDFRKPVKIKIGDLPAITQDIEYQPNETVSQKMTFKMPKVNDEKYIGQIHRVVIENEDGGTAGSDEAKPPVYIQFIKGESVDLAITEIDPKAGPSTGGTKMVISGKDFRKEMDGFEGRLKVYFGDGKDQIRVSSDNIDWNKTDTSKIVLKTPPHPSGSVTIKVENPDGNIAELENAYTYTSNPKITNIVDPLNGDIKKPSLSIEGGEEIKVVGSDFMQGARVVFNPVLTRVSEKPGAQGERIFINGVEYILESGTPGTDIEFIDSENIKVKTPSGTIDTGGVIVINPDGAATPEYEIGYVIPEISHPQKVRANLIKDEYIRINWNEVVDKATEADGKKVQYEVYMIDGTNREFLGSTATTGFIFRDIKPNKTYKFLVRAVGKYGSSKPIDESMSNEVKTGSTAGPVDQDGKPGENTTVNKTGDTGNVVIGEDAFTSGSEYVIDLTRGELAGSKDLVVSMSAKIVVDGKNRNIKVVGSDYNLSFSPNVFENSTLRNNKDKSSAGVKFEVSPSDGRFELSNNRGDTILASNYLLEAKAFVGASSESLENLNGKMNLILDYDQDLARRRRFKESDINLVKYDPYDRTFKEVFGNRSSYGTSIGDIDGLGRYTITGSRR